MKNVPSKLYLNIGQHLKDRKDFNSLPKPSWSRKPRHERDPVFIRIAQKESATEIIESQWSIFWDKYPRKIAKKKAYEKFVKLTEKQRKKILESIDSFVAHRPFEGYTLPHPLTYINQERWDDEIAPNEIVRHIDIHFMSLVTDIDFMSHFASSLALVTTAQAMFKLNDILLLYQKERKTTTATYEEITFFINRYIQRNS